MKLVTLLLAVCLLVGFILLYQGKCDECTELYHYRNRALNITIGQTVQEFEGANSPDLLAPAAPPLIWGLSHGPFAKMVVTHPDLQNPLTFHSIDLSGNAYPDFELSSEIPIPERKLERIRFRHKFSNNDVTDTLRAIAAFQLDMSARNDCTLEESKSRPLSDVLTNPASNLATLESLEKAFSDPDIRLVATIEYSCPSHQIKLIVDESFSKSRHTAHGFDVSIHVTASK